MIRKGCASDLKEVNELLGRLSLNPMTEDHFQDSCLVGEIDGKIRGVIWAGVSQSKFMACVDYFAVDSSYPGLGFRLAKAGLKMLHEQGVKRILTFVGDHPEREIALRINERFGLKREPYLVHLLTGETKEMVKLWDKAYRPLKSPS